MEISEPARKMLDSRIDRIMEKIDVYESDKTDLQKELLSHFYDASIYRASSRGSGRVENQDVEAVFSESEDPEDVARAYMSSYVESMYRAGIVSSAIAFVLDTFILAVLIVLCIAAFLLPLMLVGVFVTNDWGLAPFFSTLAWMGALILAVSYFILPEGRFGVSPGKMIMGLRVLKTNGIKIGYKEAILRNIPKILGNSALILVDALLMVLIYRKERQRVFDRVAETIVVHDNRKKTESE